MMRTAADRMPVMVLVLVASYCLMLTSCGPAPPFDIVSMRGKVLYGDDTPIPGHQVVAEFHSQVPPKSPKEYPRQGRAEVGPDGNILSITTWKPDDGLIVGPHKVVIRSLDEKQMPTDAIPQAYTSVTTTPLVIEIVAGGAPLEIKIPKPKK